jgi:hypothetical protein
VKLVRPSAKQEEPPEGAAENDFIQRLKFSAYETTLDGLAAKNLTPDRISPGFCRTRSRKRSKWCSPSMASHSASPSAGS